MDLAKRLQPFGVKVIATKRSWASYAQHASKLSRSIFLPSCCGLSLVNKPNLFFEFLTCSLLLVEDDAEDLVDVKGSHEDIYEFARKADIVVCCLTLNRETVGPFVILHLIIFGELPFFLLLLATLVPHLILTVSLK